MAKPEFLFQGIIKDNDHISALKSILREANNRILISVAFVTEDGVQLLQSELKRNSKQTTVFLGIRNGITSAQGLLALLRSKVKVIAVDTGYRSMLFHPKLYLADGDYGGVVVIGSANLTRGGLRTNIEASTVLRLDPTVESDRIFTKAITDALEILCSDHPKHVFEITSKRQIVQLLRQGRIENEEVVSPHREVSQTTIDTRDPLPRMKTFQPKSDLPERKPPSKKTLRVRTKGWSIVWESRGLTERDLNVPTGLSTNPTGSMLFKRGNMKGIDQRTFFRETVFDTLRWSADPEPRHRHLHRTIGTFQIVIKGIDCGTFNLRLTHNTRKDTASYHQANSMTQIHWGEAREFIAKRDLLGRTMHLYRNREDSTQFLMQID